VAGGRRGRKDIRPETIEICGSQSGRQRGATGDGFGSAVSIAGPYGIGDVIGINKTEEASPSGVFIKTDGARIVVGDIIVNTRAANFG